MPTKLPEQKWGGLRSGSDIAQALDLQAPGSRLEFHCASSHLSQRKPGYYLILLRNELRHRSLRRNCSMEKEA